jgi:hypothetical protein
VNKGVFMSLMGLGHELEFCRVVIHPVRAELREVVSRVGPGVKKGLKVERFRSEIGQDIKGMSRDGVREVGDNDKAIPCIGGFIGGCGDGWRGVRKSGGRVRM